VGSSWLGGLCFFFQAEDGIRDLYVTGVQTCALPIYRVGPARQRACRLSLAARVELVEIVGKRAGALGRLGGQKLDGQGRLPQARSEERRVGKKWRAGRLANSWR